MSVTPAAPHRRHRWTLHLEADDRRELIGALRALLHTAEAEERFPEGASGGCGSGWWIDYMEDPSVTPESYQAELRRYLGELRAAEVPE